MKYLTLFIFTVSVGARASTPQEISEISDVRLRNHDYVYDNLKDLNFVRMKLDANTKSWNEITAELNSISQECRPGSPGLNIANCSSRVNLLLSTARLRQTELSMFELSNTYQQLSRKAIYQDMRLNRFVDANKRTYSDLIASMTKLRDAVSTEAAEAAFQLQISRMKEADQGKRLEIQCAMLPSIQNQKFVTAQLLRREAEIKSDPHLLIKADLMVMQIEDTRRSLKRKCKTPDEQLPSTVNFVREAPAFLRKIPELARRACGKVGTGELKRPCERGDISPDVLFSLHVALTKAAR